MKVSTFYRNVGKFIDECIEKNPDSILYENSGDGVYFVKDRNRAYYAYFLPNYALTAVDDSHAVDFLSKACKATAYLSESRVYGKNKKGKKIVRISNNCGSVQFFDRTLVNKFPDNADFYLCSGKYEPAVVGIWDKKDARLHICGCICPLAITDSEFVAD